MSIELRKDCAYSLLVPTSMGVRLTAVNHQPMHCSDTFIMQATSAESNVASVSSYLALPVKVLTTFVKGSPIARFIKDNLASRHMDYEGKELDQSGPWGYRHQFNLADSWYGSRGPRVHNDRSGKVARMLNVNDFDLDRIFVREGVQIVHMSGLIAALSPETGTFCLELARAAKKHGTGVSFDLNHRASFWKGREQELGELFRRIAELSDILLGELSMDIVMLTPGMDNLHIIPAGTNPLNPAELLSSEATGELFRELREEFDVIIVDTPPVIPVTDAVIVWIPPLRVFEKFPPVPIWPSLLEVQTRELAMSPSSGSVTVP